MKNILFFLQLSAYLFSAKIGFINSDGANCVRPLEIEVILKKNGHSIEATSYKFANKYDLIISQNKLAPNSKIAKRTILLSMEPKILFKEFYDKKITRNYARVYTFDHDLCDNKKYEKMFYPYLSLSSTNTLDLLINFSPFKNRKLACLLNSIIKIDSSEENYSKRVKVAKFYD